MQLLAMLPRVEMPRPPKEVMLSKKKEPQKRRNLLVMPPRAKSLRALLFLFLSRLLLHLPAMILREEMLQPMVPLLPMVRRLLPRRVRPRRRLPLKLLLHPPRPKL